MIKEASELRKMTEKELRTWLSSIPAEEENEAVANLSLLPTEVIYEILTPKQKALVDVLCDADDNNERLSQGEIGERANIGVTPGAARSSVGRMLHYVGVRAYMRARDREAVESQGWTKEKLVEKIYTAAENAKEKGQHGVELNAYKILAEMLGANEPIKTETTIKVEMDNGLKEYAE